MESKKIGKEGRLGRGAKKQINLKLKNQLSKSKIKSKGKKHEKRATI